MAHFFGNFKTILAILLNVTYQSTIRCPIPAYPPGFATVEVTTNGIEYSSAFNVTYDWVGLLS